MHCGICLTFIEQRSSPKPRRIGFGISSSNNPADGRNRIHMNIAVYLGVVRHFDHDSSFLMKSCSFTASPPYYTD